MRRLITSLILSLPIGLAPILSASAWLRPQTTNAASPQAQTATTSGSDQTTGQPADEGWPRGYKTPSGAQVVLYQPQAASWDEQKHMVAYAAASYLPLGKEKPELGTLKIEADTEVAVAERLVRFSVLKITETNFPTLPKEQVQELITEIDKTIPPEDRFIALDRVL